ncbi:MAG TPA: ComF family protein [Geobacteraceae bacterium]|nr:ComF family protein [Geobacteraceae bacterium]
MTKNLYRSLIPADWSRIISPLLDLLFPPLCHCCRAFIPEPGQVRLCPDCLENALPIEGPLCNCCGRPFATAGGIDHLCGPCTLTPPTFVASRSALRYDKTTRELIHSFKYGYKVMLRRPLGLLAAPHLDPFVAGFGADLILPVPLHVKRLRQRGFNQSLLLAEIFASRWDIPLSRHNLRRTRWTEPQVNLSAAERAENVRGAFSLAKPEELAGKKVLLVDDVYTTGSTVKECCRVLQNQGGAVAAVLTLARGVD